PQACGGIRRRLCVPDRPHATSGMVEGEQTVDAHPRRAPRALLVVEPPHPAAAEGWETGVRIRLGCPAYAHRARRLCHRPPGAEQTPPALCPGAGIEPEGIRLARFVPEEEF